LLSSTTVLLSWLAGGGLCFLARGKVVSGRLAQLW